MNGWLVTTLILLGALLSTIVTVVRGTLEDALVGLATGSVLTVLLLSTIGIASGRANYLDVPLLLALVSIVGTIAMARFLERWL